MLGPISIYILIANKSSSFRYTMNISTSIPGNERQQVYWHYISTFLFFHVVNFHYLLCNSYPK